MNKWSKSLPSIIPLTTNSMLLQQPSHKNFSDDDSDSLTDVSIIIQTKSSSINNDQISKYSTNNSTQDQLFQSLIAYANSFHFDETVYSIQDFQTQFDSKQRTKSIKNHPIISSACFSPKKTEDDNSDENTTVTDGSKFEWEYSSDTINHSNKSYDIKTNLQNLEDLSSPIIICEKTKDRFLPQTIDIQVLRSPTPIIVREILPKPNRLISAHHLLSSSIAPIQYHPLSKPPIIPKRKINDQQISSNQSKNIIIEYDQINIAVNKHIKQRKQIKRIDPNTYIQQYGSSLYPKETFHKVFTKIIS